MAEGKKVTARSANYQDNVTRPLSRDYDDNVTADVDPEEINADMDPDTDSTDPAIRVLSVVERVSETCSLVQFILKACSIASKGCQGHASESSASPSLGT